jgi:hypothetical protein
VRRRNCQTYTSAALYPQEDSWYSFLLEAESTPGPQWAARKIRSIEKLNYLIRNRTRELPAFTIVPQCTTPPRAPPNSHTKPIFNSFGHFLLAATYARRLTFFFFLALKRAIELYLVLGLVTVNH